MCPCPMSDIIIGVTLHPLIALYMGPSIYARPCLYQDMSKSSNKNINDILLTQ